MIQMKNKTHAVSLVVPVPITPNTCLYIFIGSFVLFHALLQSGNWKPGLFDQGEIFLSVSTLFDFVVMSAFVLSVL